MGFGSILKAANPISMVSSAIGAKAFGAKSGAFNQSVLQGLPFVGEGFAQQNQQQFSAQQAQNQMAFQKMMSDTAHQRQMKDLKKAGLNPILGMAQGGASSPAGASGSSGIASGGGSSANMLKDMYNQVRQKNAVEIQKTKEDTKTAQKQQKVLEATRQAQQASAGKAHAETKNIQSMNQRAQVDEEFNKENKSLINSAKKADLIMNSISNAIGTFGGGVGKFFQGLGKAKRRMSNKKTIKRIQRRQTKRHQGRWE